MPSDGSHAGGTYSDGASVSRSRDALRAVSLFSRDREWLTTDEATRERCSRDMSIYRIVPIAVADPRDEDDLEELLAFSAENGVPLIPRGGGTNTGGSAIGRGIVVRFRPKGRWDFVEPDGERRVRCGPAARHDAVQAALGTSGAYLPSDPSSGPISSIGGNVATKASGPHALKYGAIDRYVESLRVITSCGAAVATSVDVPSYIEAAVNRAIRRLKERPRLLEHVERKAKMKCASSYNLAGMLYAGSAPGRFEQLIVGSAGTLGFVTEVTVRGEPMVSGEASLLAFFRDGGAACEAVEGILEARPDAVELMDDSALSIVAERHPSLGLPEGSHAMLLVEFVGDGSVGRAEDLGSVLDEAGLSAPPMIRRGMEESGELWQVRKRLFPTLRRLDENLRAYSVVNDIGVPVSELATFLRGASRVFAQLGIRAPIYGHAGSGNLHLRPLFDRRDRELASKVRTVAERIYHLAVDLGGTTSAEHGMGRLRSPFLALEWGEDLVSLMREIKLTLDPLEILNPDVLTPSPDLLGDAVLD